MASTATQAVKSKIPESGSEPRQSASEHTNAPEKSTGTMDPRNMGDDPEQQEIAQLAYSYWEAREGINGSAEEDWFRAEAELRGSARRKASSSAAADTAGELSRIVASS